MLEPNILNAIIPQLGLSVVFLFMLSMLWKKLEKKDAEKNALTDKLLEAFLDNAVAINNNTKAIDSLEKTINGKK